jgi:hypothetical protein
VSSPWVRDGEKPFGTLLSHLGTYVHPEVHYKNFPVLKQACGRPVLSAVTMRFKDELRQVIVGDRDELPEGAIAKAAEYDDGSEEAFVKRLWTELFPDEPLPTKD